MTAWKRAAEKAGAELEAVTAENSRLEATIAMLSVKEAWLDHLRIAYLMAALEGLYEHTKNNKQICGLNEIAREALEGGSHEH